MASEALFNLLHRGMRRVHRRGATGIVEASGALLDAAAPISVHEERSDLSQVAEALLDFGRWDR